MIAPAEHALAASPCWRMMPRRRPPHKESPAMIDAPETVLVEQTRVSCEGQGGALGHPRVWYVIGEAGFVECKYCDRRFVLKGGPADHS